MDPENINSQNWLEMWRQRKGLSLETVDEILSIPSGWTQRCEHLGLMRVPGFLLAKFARIYEVPSLELHDTVVTESSRWRRQFS